MDTLNQQVPESVSFPEAIEFTQSLLEQMETGKLNDHEIQSAITSLVKSENGARGFFVTYLTDERIIADNPSTGIICALQSSPEIISELLVKNLAMSAAMAITHRRNNNQEMAQGSERVHKRTVNIIQQIQLDLVNKKLQQLGQSAKTGEGVYETFFQRWGYDAEQRDVIQQAVALVISH